ncbi:DUF58 domain-containing protein [Bacillus tianshenii]|uniref:DUF58 domain-containing protein n=1 Tax=Sutcliffiella tianshenii TaxID=1463404 RepID=UPI001CD71983|nr:DUF58 domain-containing protein [Bacillus tianshenii]MCA1319325.1 DUF58 domain-containing protein [Bacillus tianshenii]
MGIWSQQIDNLNHHKYLRAGAFILMFGGMLSGNAIFFFIGSLYMFYFLACYLYLDRVGRKLEFSIVEEQIKLFPNDEGKFTIKLEQHSRLPIFFGNIHLAVDKNLKFQAGDERKQMSILKIPFSIMGKGVLQIAVPFTARSRGVAKIRRVEIDIRHFMDAGKVYRHKTDLIKFEAIVYSERKVVAGMERIVPRNQGSYAMKSSLFEDRTTIVGTRDYQDGDAFNKVHWKASARMAKLQTKLHERTSQFSWLLVVDIRSSDFEERLKAVTFLLHHAAANHIPFSLLVNIKKAGKPSYFELPSGEGKKQLQMALTFLARLQSNNVAISMDSFERITFQHALTSPYVIICADQERIAGWKMPSSTKVYNLDGTDQLFRLNPWRSDQRQEVQYG